MFLWGWIHWHPLHDVPWGISAMLLLVTALRTQTLEWISQAGKSMEKAPCATCVREEQHPEIKRI